MDAFRFAVEGLPDGQYDVEWWETWKGSLRRAEQVRVRGGRLALAVPSLAADEAIKIKEARRP